MKETVLAERYAKALFQAVSSGPVRPETVQEELSKIHKLILAQEGLKESLKHPLIPYEKKKMLIQKALGAYAGECSPRVLNFVDLLLAKKRLELFPLIVTRFEQAVNEAKGAVRIYLKSAAKLDEKSRDAIQKKLAQFFKKDVELEASVHPELLAGVLIKSGDTVIDNTLRAKLKNLKIQLNG